MILEPLATVEQLGAFLQLPLDASDSSASLMLDIASGMVRDFLQQDISLVTDDVVELDPLPSGFAMLNEFPIVDVSLVESFDGTVWSTAVLPAYSVSKRTGVIRSIIGQGVTWPYGAATWRVTYTHGFETVPDSIIGVVLGVAARAYSSPASIESERIGGYQVKYSMQADGFSPIEKASLSRYMVARVA
ncbi:hypothetical protein [Glaciihabitans sp. UYNi722]|uniref:hypothetical protein n=1 Tax=Glaciihabitans sp. UYNi722 TaxID=3156344 RepID=UPI003394DF2D